MQGGHVKKKKKKLKGSFHNSGLALRNEGTRIGRESGNVAQEQDQRENKGNVT